MPESDPRQEYVKNRREQLAKLKGCVANTVTNMLNNICDKSTNVVSDCVCAVLLLNQWDFSAGLEHLLDRFEVCAYFFFKQDKYQLSNFFQFIVQAFLGNEFFKQRFEEGLPHRLPKIFCDLIKKLSGKYRETVCKRRNKWKRKMQRPASSVYLAFSTDWSLIYAWTSW